MSDANLESKAFYRATLKSESYRTGGLLGLLGILLAYTIVRALAFGEFRLLLALTVVLAMQRPPYLGGLLFASSHLWPRLS